MKKMLALALLVSTLAGCGTVSATSVSLKSNSSTLSSKSVEGVRLAHARFAEGLVGHLDRNGDTKVTRAEWNQSLSLGEGDLNEYDIVLGNGRLPLTFEQFDLDKDNAIVAKDFQAYFASEAKIRFILDSYVSIWDQLDRDKNKKLEWTEFLVKVFAPQLLRNVENDVQKVLVSKNLFKKWDTNSDSYITLTELQDGAVSSVLDDELEHISSRRK